MKEKTSFFSIYKQFISNGLYCAILILVGICTYGFLITHYAIGIDDTAISMYFDEGLAPFVGRFTLYVINQIVPLTKMSPFWIEAISMLVLLCSATMWCVLLKRICENCIKFPIWLYAILAGIFVSCPLISEVYVYYLHNGICIAYGLVALALWFFLEATNPEKNINQTVSAILFSASLLTIAAGCYESMLLLYVIAAIMIFVFLRITEDKKNTNILRWIIIGAIILLSCWCLRSVIVSLINRINDFERVFGELDSTQRTSILGGISRDTIVMNLKWFFIKYVINALCYTPIKMLLLSYLVLGGIALAFSIMKRDVWIAICAILVPCIPMLMCFVDENAINYRAAQYVPVVIMFAACLLVVFIWRIQWKARFFRTICIVMLSVLLCIQVVEMNRWFVADYARYESEKEILEHVAQDLQASCDVNKPIIFCGADDTPVEVTKSSALSFSDPKFPKLRGMFDKYLPGMTGKNYCPYGYGYHFRETIFYNTISWGIEAFDGKGTQILAYLEMLGYSFKGEDDLRTIRNVRAEVIHSDMPEYPNEGYIKECDNYIIVNF